MAGQIQPENEHELAPCEQEKGGTEHPEDDLLLAYANHQHLNNWIEIHKHILQCRVCQQECLEYEQLGTLISDGIQEHQATQVYPSIANSLLERIERENAQSWRKRVAGRVQLAYTSSPLKSIVERATGTGPASEDIMPLSPVSDTQFKRPGAFASMPTPGQIQAVQAPERRTAPFRTPIRAASHVVALVVFTAVFSVAIVVWASPAIFFKLDGNSSGPSFATTVPQQRVTQPVSPTGTAIPEHITTPTPTQQPRTVPTSVPTLSPGSWPGQGSETPAIQLCSTQSDINHWTVRICSSGFKPRDRVWMFILLYGGSRTQVLTANAQGNVQYAFTISSCKSVPFLVIVRDQTHPGKPQELQKIAFGSCSAPTASNAYALNKTAGQPENG